MISLTLRASLPRFSSALCNYLIGTHTVIVDCFLPEEHASENELELVVLRSFQWNQLVVLTHIIALGRHGLLNELYCYAPLREGSMQLRGKQNYVV